jgi:signal transduction histidine kinase
VHVNLRQKYCLAFTGGVVGAAAVSVWIWPAQRDGILAMTAAAIAGGWITAWVSMRRLQRSIGRLRVAAELVGRGEFAHRLSVREDDQLSKLAHAFNEMADALERTAEQEHLLREQLARSERLAAIGELAATVAHEVNNPLDGMQNCSRIARRHSDDPAQVRRMLDLIDSGLYRVEMIVRRLLSFARDEAMNLAPVSLADVIDDAVVFVQPKLEKHQVTFERALGDAPVFAMGDRTQLAQVTINLLLNAVDSTAPGGRIVVSAAPAADASDEVVLAVADDGEGIDAEHLPRIFEPFFSTKGPGAGTGLGLAVVKKVVEAHDGRVAVTSRAGQGTRFEIRLPTARSGQLLQHEGSAGRDAQAIAPAR